MAPEERKPRIAIQVESEFISDESHPQLNHYHFAYHIRIKNIGSTTAQLISRHWVITNGNGAVHEVRGEGVVGKQPLLHPGEEFQYSSACPLDTPMGMMQGAYQMLDQDGRNFDVAIEPFILNAETHFN